MAKMRVHDLAKEYGMASKELLEHLQAMKIPAKSASSTLEDAYISIVRKNLKPILEARAQEIEAKRQAEEKEREEAEKLAREQAEQERIAAEKRREEERKQEEERRAAEEAARAEQARLEQERLDRERAQLEEQERLAAEEARRAAEEAEKNRIKDTAPKLSKGFGSLLDQINQQAEVLKEQKAEEAQRRSAQKAEAAQRRDHGKRRSKNPNVESKVSSGASAQVGAARRSQDAPAQGRAGEGPHASAQLGRVGRTGRTAQAQAAGSLGSGADHKADRQGFSSNAYSEHLDHTGRQDHPDRTERNQGLVGEGDSGRRKGKKRRGSAPEDDHYSRMAREAEAYNRSRVLKEAREAVEEASRESTGRRRKRKERRQKQAEEAAKEQRIEKALANDQDLSQLDTVRVPQGSTVGELAELLGVPANDIIKRLFLLGTPLTLTESMSDDLIELIADDLGADVKVLTKEEENSFSFYDDPTDLLPRSPVVTVMGHVDHGKTSLLDAIRHTGVAAGEAGGITQAIGASHVEINGKSITFIDTPGHETFTAMRARGAKVTDIVILIVAADDGVMPQTVESINHAKAAGVPIVVAVNKIDKAGANPDKVRQELTEYGIIPEDWGGQNMFVNISAKQKSGIDDLLEAVLLQAEVLELKANPNTFASGYVLEGKLDRGRGSVATMLINRGTLHVGDILIAGLAYGRVRAMLDPRGEQVEEAKPSEAVEILGLQSVPMAGDEFRVFQDDREARELANERALKARIEEQNRVKHVTLENLFDSMADAEIKELNLIIKADVQGSIEALSDSLNKMDQSEVRINVIHAAVGAVTETDVALADASNAIIIGFGVRPETKARAAAEKTGVEIRSYSVIYKAIEEIDAARIGMLKPTEQEVQTGVAEVRDTFKVPKVGIAAGCMVSEGDISREDLVRLVRDGIVVYEGKITSLRRYKDDVKSVHAGFECGIGLENFQDIHPGDQIEAYRIEQVARTE